jgi:hypothetical protein
MAPTVNQKKKKKKKKKKKEEEKKNSIKSFYHSLWVELSPCKRWHLRSTRRADVK